MTAIDKIAQAVVSLIPDSWKKAFVDFWNGPWRSVIIIGLATIAAVAITAATLGAGAPVAAVLLAAVIGGSIAGTAYFGGEMVSRESDIALSSQGKGMYVAGFGDIQIGKDGKPIPPPGLTKEKQEEFDKQTATSMSNFNLQHDQNGQVTGYDRKSGSEITNYATQEGMKGFAEGAISSGLAVAGGSIGGAAVKGLGLAAESTMGSVVSAGVSNVITGPIQSTMTGAFDAGFEAMKSGKSPLEAFKAGLAAGGKAIKDPGSWAAAMLTMGVAPIKLNMITKPLEGALEGTASKVENELAKTVIKEGRRHVHHRLDDPNPGLGRRRVHQCVRGREGQGHDGRAGARRGVEGRERGVHPRSDRDDDRDEHRRIDRAAEDARDARGRDPHERDDASSGGREDRDDTGGDTAGDKYRAASGRDPVESIRPTALRRPRARRPIRIRRSAIRILRPRTRRTRRCRSRPSRTSPSSTRPPSPSRSSTRTRSDRRRRARRTITRPARHRSSPWLRRRRTPTR